MLHQILRAFEEAREPLNLDQLARRLEIERSALEGMIGYWVRKGRIREIIPTAQPGCPLCALQGKTCKPEAEPCTYYVLAQT